MDAQQVFTAGQQGLYLLLLVSAPILIAVLAVGLIVSVFQAATQINEATLTFVPKVLAGEAIAALAVPEPRGGSDVASLTTRARRHGEGPRHALSR